jgi:hypothetical protein
LHNNFSSASHGSNGSAWVSWAQTWRSSFISEMWWVSYKGFGVWLPPSLPIFQRTFQGEVPRWSAFRNASWSSICMSG